MWHLELLWLSTGLAPASVILWVLACSPHLCLSLISASHSHNMVSFEAPRITVSLVTWYLLLFVPVIPQLNFSCIFNLKLQLLFICSVISDFLQSRGLQHVRLYPGASSNSCLLSQQCHPIISSSVVPFSSCLQSFPALRVFSNESALQIQWPKNWSFSFNNSPLNEYLG